MKRGNKKLHQPKRQFIHKQKSSEFQELDHFDDSLGRKTNFSNLKPWNVLKKEYKDSFAVRKKEDPFRSYNFEDEAKVEMARRVVYDKDEPKLLDRSPFLATDQYNWKYDCYVIPKHPAAPETKNVSQLKRTTAMTSAGTAARTSRFIRLSQRPASIFKKKEKRRRKNSKQGSQASLAERPDAVKKKTAPSPRTRLGSLRGSSARFKKTSKSKSLNSSTNIRTIKKRNRTHNASVRLLFAEFGVLALSSHENLQTLKTTILHEQTLFVFCESLSGHDVVNLEDMLRTRDFDEDWDFYDNYVAYIMKYVVQVINYLHQNSRVLVDFSLKNVFIKNHSLVKIGNIRFAQQLQQNTPLLSGILGKASYIAPEMINSSYGCSVDIWSLGIMARELGTGILEENRIKNDENNIYPARTALGMLIQASRKRNGLKTFPSRPKLSATYKDFIFACLKEKVGSTSGSKSASGTLSNFALSRSLPRETGRARHSFVELRNSRSVCIEELSPRLEEQLHQPKVNGNVRATAQDLLKHSFLKTAVSKNNFVAFFSSRLV